MEEHTHAHHSTGIYYVIFLALMVLLAVTIGLAYVNLEGFNLAVAMVVAVVKSGLVIWFFMHVRENPPIIYVCIGAGIVMLMVGIILSFGDYLTR